MKLPSLRQILTEFKRICIRFPLPVIAAVVGTAAALVAIEKEGSSQSEPFVKLLMVCVLGFPLLLGLTLIAEKRNWTKPLRLASQAAGLLLMIAYAFTLPAVMDGSPAFHIIRFLMLGAAMILFLSVGPFAGSREQNGFWHYNKELIFRAALTLFYAIVLQIGFSVALAALDQLFGIKIPGERYGELWVVIVGLFSTSFFLAGMPTDLNTLEQEGVYPKSLKIFAQYILSAVVLVYLVILYAYLAKIVLAWSWPKGWVSGLILGFSATGIASLLLLWPIRAQTENRWGRIVWRWFFVALIPVAAMLPLAVWRRIADYGITESRYLGLAVSLYLILIIGYFILGRKKDIKVIPGLLAIFALLVSLGPWSSFSVSEKSQTQRLQTLLTANTILVDGQVRPGTAVSDENAVQISSIVAYLHDMHGYKSIQPWFKEKLSRETDGKTSPMGPAEVTGLLGIEYMRGIRGWQGDERSLNASRENPVDIAGYDWLQTEKHVDKNNEEFALGKSALVCKGDHDLRGLTLTLKQADQTVESLHFDLHSLVEKVYAEYGRTNPDNIPIDKMAMSMTGDRFKARIYLRHVRIDVKEGCKPLMYTIDVLYAVKE